MTTAARAVIFSGEFQTGNIRSDMLSLLCTYRDTGGSAHSARCTVESWIEPQTFLLVYTTLIAGPVFAVHSDLEKKCHSSMGPLRVGFPANSPPPSLLTSHDAKGYHATPFENPTVPFCIRQATTSTPPSFADNGIFGLASSGVLFPYTAYDNEGDENEDEVELEDEAEEGSDNEDENENEAESEDEGNSEGTPSHPQSLTSSSDDANDSHSVLDCYDYDYPGREITTTRNVNDVEITLYHPKPQYPCQDITGEHRRWSTPHLTPSPTFPRPRQDLNRVAFASEGVVTLNATSEALLWSVPTRGISQSHWAWRGRVEDRRHATGFQSLMHNSYFPNGPPSALEMKL
ncbi:hypothetical protein BKA70DRAFT_1217456 [Coprinopsis sp. MPI-PUGE-AT-0042]|nr:hypothetical protein BKA70DRAFT_1217456 [Coprinopsis sp. MPI-PUGE-AT-0042]